MVNRIQMDVKDTPKGCGRSLNGIPVIWAGDLRDVSDRTLEGWRKREDGYRDVGYTCGKDGSGEYIWPRRPYCLTCAQEFGWEW